MEEIDFTLRKLGDANTVEQFLSSRCFKQSVHPLSMADKLL